MIKNEPEFGLRVLKRIYYHWLNRKDSILSEPDNQNIGEMEWIPGMQANWPSG